MRFRFSVGNKILNAVIQKHGEEKNTDWKRIGADFSLSNLPLRWAWFQKRRANLARLSSAPRAPFPNHSKLFSCSFCLRRRNCSRDCSPDLLRRNRLSSARIWCAKYKKLFCAFNITVNRCLQSREIFAVMLISRRSTILFLMSLRWQNWRAV